MRAARMLAPAIAAVIAAAALVVPAATAAPQSPQSQRAALSPLESGVLVDINAFRRAHHLTPLKLNVKLGIAARRHTAQMAQDGYFAHESADGSLFWKRIQSLYASSPWRYWSVGENLLWSAGDVSPESALKMWIASPEHKANLMNPRWREIGVSALHVSAAPGVYKGLDVTIVTTDFGVRY